MNNENKTLKFKTNINCSGCVAKVSPFLNEAEGVRHWNVDTDNKDKILSVKTDGVGEAAIIRKVQEAGFKIDKL